jgi:hypothetical protein
MQFLSSSVVTAPCALSEKKWLKLKSGMLKMRPRAKNRGDAIHRKSSLFFLRPIET